jgi:hypothetical protein
LASIRFAIVSGFRHFNLMEAAMKLVVLAAIIASIACSAPTGRAQNAQAPCCEDGRLIAHIEHDGLSFSIKIDAADDRYLLIGIPRKDGTFTWPSLPPVHLKVLTVGKPRTVATVHGKPVIGRDDLPPVEGPAELIHGAISMGGWADIHYRFALQRHTAIDDIHSVTISIGDQTYTVFPY